MQPPFRQSYGRSRRRRSHDALGPVNVGICPISGMPKQPHRVSRESGYVRPGLRIKVPKLKIGTSND